METQTLNPTQSAEGGSPNGGSQGSEIDSQGSNQNQNAGGTQVEGNESQSSSQRNQGGRKASTFYSDRNTVKKLQDKVAELEAHIQNNSSVSQAQSNVVNKDKEFWDSLINNPMGAIQTVIDQALSKKVPEMAKSVFTEQSTERAWQDAEKAITSNEGYSRDANFDSRLSQIIQEFGLSNWSNKDPVGATQIALKVYSERYGQKRNVNSNVPSKGQMINTATGSPAAVNTQNKDSLVSDLKAMQKQIMENPSVMRDPKFLEKLNAIKTALR